MPAYATVADIKAHPAMSGTQGTVTDARIDEVMTAVETRIEKFTGVAWVVRTATDEVYGDGSRDVLLPRVPVRSLTAVSIDGVVGDATQWTVDRMGRLKAPSALKDGAKVEVTYTHGHDAPPTDLREAAILACATRLVQSRNPRIGERTETIDYGGGPTVNFAAMPSWERNRPFGMPDVDTVVMSYDQRIPTVA